MRGAANCFMDDFLFLLSFPKVCCIFAPDVVYVTSGQTYTSQLIAPLGEQLRVPPNVLNKIFLYQHFPQILQIVFHFPHFCCRGRTLR